MSTETHFAYQELRALCRDLIAARNPQTRRQILTAIARFTQMRCLRCGALLSAASRADPREDLCELCLAELIPPPPPGYGGRPDDAEVPF